MTRLSEPQDDSDLAISNPQEPQVTLPDEKIDTKIEPLEPLPTKRGWRFWLIFPGLCFAILLAALDTAIVATVLPTIAAELNSGSLFIWAINGYFVGIAAVQPMYGQFSDIYGRRWPMLISVAIFALGSGLCGGATSTVMLIAARVVQGLGAGGIFALVEIIVADLVPLRERQQFMAAIQAFFALGTFVGPVIGGTIVTHSSWRWVFYINLPVAGVALVLLFIFLQMHHKREGTRLQRMLRVHYLGHSILIASVVVILIPLTWGGTKYSWSSYRVLVPLFLGFAGLFIFAAYQVYVAKDLASVPPRLFGNSVSTLAFVMTLIHGICMSWLSFFLPVYFQVLLEVTPEMSGAYLLATVIPLMPAAMFGGWYITKTGRYKPALIAGWVSFSLAAGLFTTLDSTSSPGKWIVFQAFGGIGGGLILTTTIPAIQGSLEEKDVGLATAIWSFVRSLGTIWGGAIPAVIFSSRFDELSYRISDPAVRSLLERGGAYEHAIASFTQSFNDNPILKAQIIDVYTEALKRVWQVLIAFTLAGVPLSIIIKEVELRTTLVTEYGLKVKEKDEDGV
ncbi:MFS general substrate transporter [Glarea lozoyensis ATCC 20868]|uniref:MFS general substrate transporter n=1 Tax=Glarea lozoyensis (strain ATCC 20868 / MF5171) TaxID=1116229 RepID=S3DIN2_GLAL2|nr:MFS general substrate transporter [Glarea lozoyensis ATCC 20868]EPE37024.1 MFS general substrate transporter [Glarea lozoyensis ATCC 20868]